MSSDATWMRREFASRNLQVLRLGMVTACSTWKDVKNVKTDSIFSKEGKFRQAPLAGELRAFREALLNRLDRRLCDR